MKTAMLRMQNWCLLQLLSNILAAAAAAAAASTPDTASHLQSQVSPADQLLLFSHMLLNHIHNIFPCCACVCP
jgi:hypothetical protein